MPFDVGAPELIIILIAVLIIFGPGKLPDLGRTLGKSIHEFRSSVRELNDEPEPLATVAPRAPIAAPIPAPSTSADVTSPGENEEPAEA